MKTIVSLSLIAMVGVVPAWASADVKAAYATEVMIIGASEANGKIDPALAKEPALKHRTFRTYRTIKLLEKRTLKAEVATPMVIPLPNGRQLTLVLQEVQSDGRFLMQMSINRPKQKDYVRSVQMVLAPGKPIFQAGQRFGDMDLILGVRIR